MRIRGFGLLYIALAMLILYIIVSYVSDMSGDKLFRYTRDDNQQRVDSEIVLLDSITPYLVEFERPASSPALQCDLSAQKIKVSGDEYIYFCDYGELSNDTSKKYSYQIGQTEYVLTHVTRNGSGSNIGEDAYQGVSKYADYVKDYDIKDEQSLIAQMPGMYIKDKIVLSTDLECDEPLKEIRRRLYAFASYNNLDITESKRIMDLGEVQIFKAGKLYVEYFKEGDNDKKVKLLYYTLL